MLQLLLFDLDFRIDRGEVHDGRPVVAIRVDRQVHRERNMGHHEGG